MDNAALPVAWVDEMPYSFISLHEFEKACGVLNAMGIQSFISGKILDPEFKRWAYGAYCNQYPNVVAELPLLFREEFDEMFADISPR